MTRAQQTSVNAWVEQSPKQTGGPTASISLEHPEDFGEHYVEVKLYDGQGDEVNSAMFYSDGVEPTPEDELAPDAA